MPNIPTYERQEKLPVSMDMPKPTANTQEAQAMSAFGKDLFDRSVQMIEEKNELDALDAIAAMTDSERGFLQEETTKQGVDAEGAVQRGEQFYDQAIAMHGQNLNRGARKVFQAKAQGVRNAGLDKLAGHQAQEFQKRRENAIKVQMDTFARSLDGSDDNTVKLDAGIIEMDRLIDLIHGGLDDDTRAMMKNQAHQKMMTQWLLARGNVNPTDALKQLNLMEDQLDPQTFKQLRGQFENEIKVREADQEYAVLRSQHGNDFPSMLKEVDEMQKEAKTPEQLEKVTRIRQKTESAWYTYKALENDARTKYNRDLNKDLANLWIDKNLKAITDRLAMEKGNVLANPETIIAWTDRVTAQTKEDAKEKKSDPEIKRVISKNIRLHADKIEVADLAKLLLEQKITTPDFEAMVNALEKYKKEPPNPKLKAAWEVIDKWEKSPKLLKAFGNNEAAKAARMAEIKQNLEQFAEMYPDKDPVKDFLQPYMDEIKKGQFDEAFEKMRKSYWNPESRETRERPPQKITKPMPDAKEDEIMRNLLGDRWKR